MVLNPQRIAALVACAGLALTAPAGAQSTDYDAALAEAARLEGAGRPRDAARALDPLAGRYPDDYALALRLGWLWFQAGDWAAAERRYARALALSGDSAADARLGLAWTALRRGDADAALRGFDRVLAAAPSDARAREGRAAALAARRGFVRLYGALWGAVVTYAGHPTRRVGYSASPSVAATLGDAVALGLTYRAFAYEGNAPPANRPMPPRAVGLAAQHELHASVGLVRPTWSLRLHGGYVADAANALAPGYVLGLSGTVALRGELAAEASATVYADFTVYRAAAQWGLALGGGWSLGPTLSVLHADTFVGGAVGGVLAYRRGGWALALAARVGDERRPTSLATSMVFAMDDHVRAAAGVTARIPLSDSLALTAAYEWLRLDALMPGGESTAADVHAVAAGLEVAW